MHHARKSKPTKRLRTVRSLTVCVPTAPSRLLVHWLVMLCGARKGRGNFFYAFFFLAHQGFADFAVPVFFSIFEEGGGGGVSYILIY